jgi:hypothetical protein
MTLLLITRLGQASLNLRSANISSFVIRHSSFVIRYSLFVIPYSSFV